MGCSKVKDQTTCQQALDWQKKAHQVSKAAPHISDFISIMHAGNNRKTAKRHVSMIMLTTCSIVFTVFYHLSMYIRLSYHPYVVYFLFPCLTICHTKSTLNDMQRVKSHSRKRLTQWPASSRTCISTPPPSSAASSSAAWIRWRSSRAHLWRLLSAFRKFTCTPRGTSSTILLSYIIDFITKLF